MISCHAEPRVSRWLESIYTLEGKNLTNMSYTWLLKALTCDNHSQVPTMSKSDPCSRDEVLALGLILPPKSKSITQSREVRFDIVVTKATRLIGPHKTWHAVSTQLKACHRDQNDVVLNRHGRVLPHINLRIATTLFPPFPPECSTDSLFAPSGLATVNKHNIYSS
jgi:hypothetical protein